MTFCLVIRRVTRLVKFQFKMYILIKKKKRDKWNIDHKSENGFDVPINKEFLVINFVRLNGLKCFGIQTTVCSITVIILWCSLKHFLKKKSKTFNLDLFIMFSRASINITNLSVPRQVGLVMLYNIVLFDLKSSV